MTPSEWSGAVVEPATGSTPPDVDEWTTVSVPGRPEAFAGADAVLYRTEFSDPRRGDDTRAVLDLRGAYANVRVWCNGESLGTHDTYFVPARFELPLEDENELLIQCRAPIDRFGGIYDTDRVPDALSVPGIWWNVSIETHPQTYVETFQVTPRSDEEGATIDALLTVDSADGIDDHATFSIRPEGFRGGGMMERVRVTVDAGERVTVGRSIEIRDPSRWWPAGLGPQHRYTVRASFRGEERVATTGVCTVDYDRTEGVHVNGRPIRLRGFCRLPGGSPIDDVDHAVAANANVVRPYAHTASPEFYDACDEAGVLVWQDLPLVGPGGYDIERAKTVVGRLVSGYGNHPSIGAFTVHTDPRDPFGDRIGSGWLARYRVRWRAWRESYDSTADDRVASTIPRGYATFPVAGPPGTNPDAAHVYPGWSYGTASDIDWLVDRYDLGRAVGAFGAGTSTDGGRNDSQADQERVLKTVAESLRRRGSHAIVAYVLCDVADGGMGVVAADGSKKAGYAAIANSFEPVQAVLDRYPLRDEESIPLTVVNDSHETVACTVTWRAGEASGSTDVTVKPLSRTNGGVAEIGSGTERVDLLVSLEDRTVTNGYPIRSEDGD